MTLILFYRKQAVLMLAAACVCAAILLLACEKTAGEKQVTREDMFNATEADFFAWQKKMRAEILLAKGKRPDHYYPQLKKYRRKFIKIYRDNPKDQIAFKSILYVFYSEKKQENRQEALNYLTTYHIENPDLYLLLVGPIPPDTLTAEYEAYFRAAIEKNPSRRARGSALVALAQSWDMAVTTQIMLREFGLSVQEYLMEQNIYTKSASQQRQNPLYYWIDADITSLRDKIKKKAQDVIASYADVKAEYYTPLGKKEIGSIGPIARGLIAGLSAAASGMPAPTLVTKDLDGNQFDLAKLKGKVVMLDFWATWCVPCIEAIPKNREMVARFKGRPFQLVTLSVDDAVGDVHDFMLDTEMPFVNLYLGPDNPLLTQWNVSSYPTIIIVDHEGIVRLRLSGEMDALRDYIGKLVGNVEILD